MGDELGHPSSSLTNSSSCRGALEGNITMLATAPQGRLFVSRCVCVCYMAATNTGVFIDDGSAVFADLWQQLLVLSYDKATKKQAVKTTNAEGKPMPAAIQL